MNAPRPKPGILEIAPYIAGKQKAAGFDAPIKLSANENPLGCSPAARAAYMAAADRIHLYPDPRATMLRGACAQAWGLEEERLVFGTGSDELFGLLCQTFVEPGDNVVQGEFGFFAYRIAIRAAGGEVRFAEQPNVQTDVDALLAQVDDRTRIVFVDNPGNPTGSWLSGREVRRLHAGLPGNVLLVLDAAYADFAKFDPDYEDGLELARDAENVVVTGTFSKIHGLAALRVGWAYGATESISAVDRIRPPFNLSIMAQAAATAALGDQNFVRRTLELTNAERPVLADGLRALGLEVAPSAANFVLPRFTDEPGRSAGDVDAALTARGILVRPLRNYGMPNHLRVSVGLPEDNRAFLDAMAEILA